MTMQKQPEFLNERVASAFQERSVVQAYQYRPMYPAETFEVLAGLLPEDNKIVLDVGCGTGLIARNLASFVTRVDAVDVSSEMIARGKKLSNGNHPNLNWHLGKAEETFPQPPYRLITAGESLHWMNWEVIMPRFAEVLASEGYLAILHPKVMPLPWSEGLTEIFRQYSTTRDFRKFDLIEELEQRQHFQKVGTKVTDPTPFVQSVKDYIESFHGRASFSRERMSKENAAAFDRALLELVKPFTVKGKIELAVSAEIVWGKPLARS
jgi:ubiquinone/menaquinone biosynthesis C-methylase UbiE